MSDRGNIETYNAQGDRFHNPCVRILCAGIPVDKIPVPAFILNTVFSLTESS